MVTGRSGSLVAWTDVVRQDPVSVELVVFDTSRREEVARVPVPEDGGEASVAYVDEDEVWFGTDGGPDRHLYRFDVSSGVTTPIHRADLDAALAAAPRIFTAVADDGRVVHGPPSFALRGSRLVAGIDDGGADDVAPVTLAGGERLRLRLPTGYVPPWPADGEGTVAVSQWLDHTHVALFADDGGGDLPAKEGDLLTCEVPAGVCQITVPRSSQPYVAPYLG